jgi:hypothetical protein
MYTRPMAQATIDNNNNGLVIYFIIIQTNLHKIYNLKLYIFKIKKENKKNYDYVYIISAIF